jgi:urease accessory protein
MIQISIDMATPGHSLTDMPTTVHTSTDPVVANKRGAKKIISAGSPFAEERKNNETTISQEALYRLMTWLSPSYPVGAFSYSSGLEWAVEANDVHDPMSLQAWLAEIISHGGGFCDAVFLVHTHRATIEQNDTALAAVAELAAAYAPSKERHLETTAQGKHFSPRREWRGPVPRLSG